MFFLYVLVIVLATWLITHWIKSATSTKIREQLEKEYQEKRKQLESEFAEKAADLKKREQEVAFQNDRWKNVDRIAQWASFRHRNADELERDLARQELDLEQREQLLHRDMEAIIDYRVQHQLSEYMKGKQKGIDENWDIIKREKRTLLDNNEKYNEKSARLDEREQKMYKRAVLIADHLGVSLNSILTPREKKLADQLANELTEEHYALTDLVMSCPDDQAKDLLKWMQRFPRS